MLPLLRKLIGRPPARPGREQALASFNSRYKDFKELLQANADLAGVLAALDQAQRGDKSIDRKSTRLNSSHVRTSRMPSSA